MRQAKDSEIQNLKDEKESQRVEMTTTIDTLEITVKSKYPFQQPLIYFLSKIEQTTTILSLESNNIALSEELARKEDVERQLETAREQIQQLIAQKD